MAMSPSKTSRLDHGIAVDPGCGKSGSVHSDASHVPVSHSMTEVRWQLHVLFNPIRRYRQEWARRQKNGVHGNAQAAIPTVDLIVCLRHL